jgi:hypothetical protein
MQGIRHDFETIDQPRAGAAEVGIAVRNVNAPVSYGTTMWQDARCNCSIVHIGASLSHANLTQQSICQPIARFSTLTAATCAREADVRPATSTISTAVARRNAASRSSTSESIVAGADMAFISWSMIRLIILGFLVSC